MSRIGRKVIAVPSGVTVEQAAGEVKVKGPKGALAQRIPGGISVQIDGGAVRVQRADDRKPTRALHGLSRALLANMVRGVTQGFVRELRIEGVGYRAETDGKVLKLALGFSHPVAMQIPQGLKVSVEANTGIKIEGIDKQLVGQFAADVRGVRPPEPYKGKGVRYAQEHVRRKVGKAGATGGK
ncbi:MAG TPA: 50S ribosomal protein L6 [Myxococcota bacterium]|jgi:large subunit ribosomal protein L6|nr:50S ribosomal protein L6 [Myxococcota bacterium]